jgi:hypothetical protein
VFTEKKRVEKLRYMHRNPVVRVWCRRRKSGTGAVTVITLWESGGRCWSTKRRRRRCGSVELHSVRWLALSRMGPWCPLAENRGEWGSLDRGGARS